VADAAVLLQEVHDVGEDLLAEVVALYRAVGWTAYSQHPGTLRRRSPAPPASSSPGGTAGWPGSPG
jgi:hypothetical protein